MVNPVPLAAVTRFQFASTPLTVTVKAVPAVRSVGLPALPVAVPGAAVSPGMSSCNFTNAPALTVIAGLVLAVLLPSSTPDAVSVWPPAVLNVTLNEFVPLTSAASAGGVALASLVEMSTVSAAFVVKFQNASTARTVTLNAVPAVCAVGVPVLPVALPGDAVSPGTSSCNFANAAGLMATTLEVALAKLPLVKAIVKYVGALCGRHGTSDSADR